MSELRSLSGVKLTNLGQLRIDAFDRCCRKSHRKRTVELEFEINESWQAGCLIKIADLLVVLNQSYAVRPPKSFFDSIDPNRTLGLQ
jgi:hypothetical protein